MSDRVCTACCTSFSPRPKMVSGGICAGLGVLLLIVSVLAAGDPTVLLPLIIGALFIVEAARRLRPQTRCPACASAATIPLDTPAGRELAAKHARK